MTDSAAEQPYDDTETYQDDIETEETDDLETEDEPEQHNPNREAAKYRTQLREAETANEYLRGVLADLLTGEVERIASQHLAQGRDLFDVGRVELADLLNDEETAIDPDRVEAAARELLATRPGLSKTVKVPDYGAGNRGSYSAGKATWSDVIGRTR